MKAFGPIARRALGFAALGGLTVASLNTWLVTVTSVLTALYTAFITVEAGLRLYERWKLKHASPRVKGVDA